jgi:hypothetical protein
MLESNLEFSEKGNLCKVTLFQNNENLTFTEVIEKWQDNVEFRQFYISLIANLPFEAIYWESPAINIDTRGRKYEFVAVESKQLARVEPDSTAFIEHFNSATTDKRIIAFENLSGDAKLVVPYPICSVDSYTHLAKFLREAPDYQCHAFFQIVGKEVSNRLNHNPLWLNTSGLGVSWLHARLDSYPKYYTYSPYKKAI